MTDPEHEFWLHLTYSAARMAVLRQRKGIVRKRTVGPELRAKIDQTYWIHKELLPEYEKKERAS